jgi:hypothetical protein
MHQGTRWVLLKQKKRSRKSHAWAPLRDRLTGLDLSKSGIAKQALVRTCAIRHLQNF